MKNKTNESNKYECVLCETGEGDKHGEVLNKLYEVQKLLTNEKP